MRMPKLKTEEEAKVFAGSIWNGANNNKTIDECIAQANKALEEYRERDKIRCPHCGYHVLVHGHCPKIYAECNNKNCLARGPYRMTEEEALKPWVPKPKMKGPLSVERLSLICGCSNGVKAIAHDEEGEEVEIKDKDKIWIEEGGKK